MVSDFNQMQLQFEWSVILIDITHGEVVMVSDFNQMQLKLKKGKAVDSLGGSDAGMLCMWTTLESW